MKLQVLPVSALVLWMNAHGSHGFSSVSRDVRTTTKTSLFMAVEKKKDESRQQDADQILDTDFFSRQMDSDLESLQKDQSAPSELLLSDKEAIVRYMETMTDAISKLDGYPVRRTVADMEIANSVTSSATTMTREDQVILKRQLSKVLEKKHLPTDEKAAIERYVQTMMDAAYKWSQSTKKEKEQHAIERYMETMTDAIGRLDGFPVRRKAGEMDISNSVTNAASAMSMEEQTILKAQLSNVLDKKHLPTGEKQEIERYVQTMMDAAYKWSQSAKKEAEQHAIERYMETMTDAIGKLDGYPVRRTVGDMSSRHTSTVDPFSLEDPETLKQQFAQMLETKKDLSTEEKQTMERYATKMIDAAHKWSHSVQNKGTRDAIARYMTTMTEAIDKLPDRQPNVGESSRTQLEPLSPEEQATLKQQLSRVLNKNEDLSVEDKVAIENYVQTMMDATNRWAKSGKKQEVKDAVARYMETMTAAIAKLDGNPVRRTVEELDVSNSENSWSLEMQVILWQQVAHVAGKEKADEKAAIERYVKTMIGAAYKWAEAAKNDDISKYMETMTSAIAKLDGYPVRRKVGEKRSSSKKQQALSVEEQVSLKEQMHDALEKKKDLHTEEKSAIERYFAKMVKAIFD